MPMSMNKKLKYKNKDLVELVDMKEALLFGILTNV